MQYASGGQSTATRGQIKTIFKPITLRENGKRTNESDEEWVLLFREPRIQLPYLNFTEPLLSICRIWLNRKLFYFEPSIWDLLFGAFYSNGRRSATGTRWHCSHCEPHSNLKLLTSPQQLLHSFTEASYHWLQSHNDLIATSRWTSLQLAQSFSTPSNTLWTSTSTVLGRWITIEETISTVSYHLQNGLTGSHLSAAIKRLSQPNFCDRRW